MYHHCLQMQIYYINLFFANFFWEMVGQFRIIVVFPHFGGTAVSKEPT